MAHLPKVYLYFYFSLIKQAISVPTFHFLKKINILHEISHEKQYVRGKMVIDAIIFCSNSYFAHSTAMHLAIHLAIHLLNANFVPN